jgi:hypothetical protein
VSLQNIADGLVGDLKSEIGQCADDTVVAPAWILTCELEHQPFVLDRNGGTSQLAFAPVGKIPFAGDQLAMPFEQGLGLDDGNDVL